MSKKRNDDHDEDKPALEELFTAGGKANGVRWDGQRKRATTNAGDNPKFVGDEDEAQALLESLAWHALGVQEEPAANAAEDQPRDDHGRWEKEGSAEEYSEKVYQIGKRLRSRQPVSDEELKSLKPEDQAGFERLRKDMGSPRTEKPEPELKVERESKNGIQQVSGKFTSLNTPDEYAYHVTTEDRVDHVFKNGFHSGKSHSMDAGFYRDYSRGKTFFADRNGVSFWQHRIEDHLQAQTDDEIPKLVVLRIPKSKLSGLQRDKIGEEDSRAGSYFIANIEQPWDEYE